MISPPFFFNNQILDSSSAKSSTKFYCLNLDISIFTHYFHYSSKCFSFSVMYLIKGQLISKGLLDVFKSTKKPTPFLKGFLPLFLERGQIKKDKVYLVYLIKFFYFFDSTSFEFLTKISLVFFGRFEDTKKSF